jgi:hypothetical protein
MNHEIQIVETKSLPNGQFAILAQCCGDKQHASWHTMADCVVTDDAKREASISEHCKRIAKQHEAALQADHILKSWVGTSRQVDPAAAPTVQ